MNKNHSIKLLYISLLICTLTIVYFVARRKKEGNPKIEDKQYSNERKELLSIKKDIAGLKEQLGKLKQQRNHRVSDIPINHKQKTNNVNNYDKVYFRKKAKNQKTGYEWWGVVAAHLDSNMSYETRDDEWAINEEQSFKEVFDYEDVRGITITDIECKNTMCRLEIIYDEGIEGMEAENILKKYRPFRKEAFIIHHNEGNQIEYFFLRSGYKWPPPPR